MTKYSLISQIKTLLLAQTWTGGSNVVFPSNSVIITTYAEVDTVMQYARTPFALVIVQDQQSDPEFGEEPDLLSVQVAIRIGVIIPGETLGEHPLMGAGRADATKSEGAGLYQIEQEVFNAIGKLNDLENITIQFRQTAGAAAIPSADKRYIAVQDIRFEMLCTAV